jgi:hypothetical protein
MITEIERPPGGFYRASGVGAHENLDALLGPCGASQSTSRTTRCCECSPSHYILCFLLHLSPISAVIREWQDLQRAIRFSSAWVLRIQSYFILYGESHMMNYVAILPKECYHPINNYLLCTLWGCCTLWLYLLIAFIVFVKIIKSCVSDATRGDSCTSAITAKHPEGGCEAAASDGNDSALTDEMGSDDRESPSIENQIRTLLYFFSEDEQNDFIDAIAKQPPSYQQLRITQIKLSNLHLLHSKYAQYKLPDDSLRGRKHDGEPSIMQPIGITKMQNAIERYRDTDYFGVKNKYDSPKWQDCLDEYEQSDYCTYFLM